MKNKLSSAAGSFLLSTVFLVSTSAYAQRLPDAGSLMRDVQQPALPDVNEVPALPVKVEPPVDKEGPSLPVQAFIFDGQTIFSNEELQKLVSNWLGKQLTLADLKYIADKIAEHYRLSGYLARVYLPEQNIKTGTVSIVIIEAKFGHVTIDGDKNSLQANPRLIEGMMTRHQQNGELFRLSDIERATLLLTDLPGINAKTILTASETAEQTDVIVSIEKQPMWFSSATIDNYGSRSSGKERLVFSSSANNPSQAGDDVKINALVSEGNMYARLGYYRPWGYDGLRAGASFSLLSYKLSGDFEALDAKGDASILSLQLDYPWIRQSQRNIRLNASLAFHQYNNERLGISTSEKAINALSFGISGDQVDSYYSGGITFYGARLVLGKLDLSGNKFYQALDAASTRTEGSYAKINWNVARLQKLKESINLWLAVRGQFTDNNLDSSESISLGGATGVRAYPALEASGDSGLLLSAELRYKLSNRFILTGFYDVGNVEQKSTLVRSSQSYTLKGYGASLDWIEPKYKITSKLSIAHRIGSNPLSSPVTGNDSDGSQNDYPVWLSLTKHF